jgi:hypothetical protein
MISILYDKNDYRIIQKSIMNKNESLIILYLLSIIMKGDYFSSMILMEWGKYLLRI